MFNIRNNNFKSFLQMGLMPCWELEQKGNTKPENEG